MKNFLLHLLQKILAILARHALKKSHPDIIGVTGSVGKSSTRESIYQVLKSKYKNQVKESTGNLNNEIGLPLVILGYDKNIQWWNWPLVLIISVIRTLFSNPIENIKILVLEYAADNSGDISYLTSIVKPKVAVITKIANVHTLSFGSLEAVSREKSRLINVLPKDGYAILNKDDPYTEKIKSETKAKIIYFSENKFNTHKEIAKIVGKLYGIDIKESEKVLSNLKPLKGRLNIIDGINHSTIIDDTHNSNPCSCRLAIDYLSKQKGRRIAVLGDMLELGSVESEEHEKIAQITKENCDLFITVGKRFKDIKSDYWFSDPVSAGEYLLSKIQKNDIILVKGSQGMRMEKVVEKILAKPEKAAELLVRQNSAWKKKPFRQV